MRHLFVLPFCLRLAVLKFELVYLTHYGRLGSYCRVRASVSLYF